MVSSLSVDANRTNCLGCGYGVRCSMGDWQLTPPHTGNPAVREGVHTHTRVALLSGRGYTQSPASQAQVREDREALVTDCRRATWGRPFHPSTSQGLVKREEMQDLQGIIPSSRNSPACCLLQICSHTSGLPLAEQGMSACPLHWAV